MVRGASDEVKLYQYVGPAEIRKRVSHAPPGVRIEMSLAGLAQMPRIQRGGGARVDPFAAVLLDEDAVDRGLALRASKILASPPLAAETRRQIWAQLKGDMAKH